MKRSARILCGAVLSAWACVAFAQNSPPEPSPKPLPSPAPQKAPSPESPQHTKNAGAQAESEYRSALANCDARPQTERQGCVSQAEERFYGALAGAEPGEQGNRGSSGHETGK